LGHERRGESLPNVGLGADTGPAIEAGYAPRAVLGRTGLWSNAGPYIHRNNNLTEIHINAAPPTGIDKKNNQSLTTS